MHSTSLCRLLALFALASSLAAAEPVLDKTQPLTATNDLSAAMVAGISRFLSDQLAASIPNREALWHRDFSSTDAYWQSVQPNRERFRGSIGAVDDRVPIGDLELIAFIGKSISLARSPDYDVFAVRWPVFAGVFGEGLLLRPHQPAIAAVIALPDADQTPEMLAGLAPGLNEESQFARRLAEQECLVLIPALIDRRANWSGSEGLRRFTNQPHREWIWRQAFEVGRHIIGYEVQKILAGVDWLEREQRTNSSSLLSKRIGLAGYGEGGLLALYAAALDRRIDVTLVSGYFDSRQNIWEEPIYRDVWALLHEFGDAEIASLVAPRRLIVEYSEAPQIDGPPKARSGQSNVAAPGRVGTPEFHSVELEVERANALVAPLAKGRFIDFKFSNEGQPAGPGAPGALLALLQQLNPTAGALRPSKPPATPSRSPGENDERQRRQLEELVQHTQRLLQVSERTRESFFWKRGQSTTPETWQTSTAELRTNMWEELIGKFPSPTLPMNPRSRLVHEMEKWTGYDVMLDVWPNVFAWGVLLVPKNIKAGEQRPVVVCQHGLEGLPEDTITQNSSAPGWRAYKGFSARLAEEGFVVFAPHNPYRGNYAFRVLQRKAHPLKKSLFSVILGQHDRILDWLASLPFVDPKRIGFYGLSYGGKTAMRVPALLDRYALSICSADFNEWAKKCATIDSAYSYLYTVELDMYEFNLAHTFNYAEMAGLIAPRPFMVERGHDDGVAPDEWVAHEYARAGRLYAKLGLAGRTEIEFFSGPHTINGEGTFRFLHNHLRWGGRN